MTVPFSLLPAATVVDLADTDLVPISQYVPTAAATRKITWAQVRAYLASGATPVVVGAAAYGYKALAVSTGTYNTAFGYQSLPVNTTGFSNTALGAQALLANITGAANVAVGVSALQSVVSTSNNTAVGASALQANIGSNNTALGSIVLTATTTGSNNTAGGVAALYRNITGSYNTALGTNTLSVVTASQNNTAIGASAMLGWLSGDSNVAIGTESLYGNIRTTQGWDGTAGDSTYFSNAAAHFTLLTGWTQGTGTTISKSADGLGALVSILGVYDYGVGGVYTIGYTIANLTVGSVTVSFGGFADPAGARSANGTYSFSATPTAYPGGLTYTPSNTARFDVTTGSATCTSGGSAGSNVAVGSGCGYMTTTGYNNVYMGIGAARQHTTGNQNVAVGTSAMVTNGTGNDNTSVGFYAGYSNNTGIRNTVVGSLTHQFGTSGDKNTALGYQTGNINVGSQNLFLGYQSGLWETAASNTFMVDTQLRADLGTQRAAALFYGTFNAVVASQTLQINAPVFLTQAAVAGSAGQAVLGATTQSTVGANGAASALTANPLGYLVAYVGTAKVAIPYYNG